MKKVLMAVIPAICLLMASCASKTDSMTETAQKNLDAMRGIQQCIESKDLSKLGDYIANDAVDHAAPGGITGLDKIREYLSNEIQMVDSAKNEKIFEFANDDYAVVWNRHTAILKSGYMNMKAGDKITGTAIEVGKFSNGKLTDHWTFLEPAEMMKMMGGGQAPVDTTQKAPSDTSKNQ